MPKNSSYYDMVYYVTDKIPSGRVSTYGAIADYLSLGSARMVGWALTQCNQNGRDDVPCHRVVNRKGELSGRIHFKTPTLMEERLAQEGVKINENCVQNFDHVYWHPSELDL